MRLNLDKPRELIVEVADATITVRILSTEEIVELRKQHTRTKSVMGEVTEDFNQRAYSVEFWDRVIVAWTGLEDDNGNAIPCNRGNKHRVVNQYGEIVVLINDAIEAERKRTITLNEEAEKN